jgi:YD repeat-containing protein
LTEKDGKGYTTLFEYDKVGRIVKTTNPDNSTIKVVYDDSANKQTITNEIGRVVETAYNGLGYPLTEKDITDSAAPVSGVI